MSLERVGKEDRENRRGRGEKETECGKQNWRGKGGREQEVEERGISSRIGKKGGDGLSEEKEDEMGKKMEEGLEMSGTIIMIYARYMMLG